MRAQGWGTHLQDTTLKNVGLADFYEEHSQAYDDQGHGEDATEHEFRDVLGAHAAEVGAYGESRSQQQTGFEVGVAVTVVLPKSEDADGGEHGGERGALGAVLAHVKEVDQRGNHEDSAAEPDYSGK